MEDIEHRVEKARKLLESEQYTEALEALLPYANIGNADAQASVGFIYQNGLGVSRNIHKAIYWLRKAADSGKGDAAHNLGTLYLTCEPDVPQDFNESKKWYKKAKELGFIASTDANWFEQR